MREGETSADALFARARRRVPRSRAAAPMVRWHDYYAGDQCLPGAARAPSLWLALSRVAMRGMPSPPRALRHVSSSGAVNLTRPRCPRRRGIGPEGAPPRPRSRPSSLPMEDGAHVPLAPPPRPRTASPRRARSSADFRATAASRRRRRAAVAAATPARPCARASRPRRSAARRPRRARRVRRVRRARRMAWLAILAGARARAAPAPATSSGGCACRRRARGLLARRRCGLRLRAARHHQQSPVGTRRAAAEAALRAAASCWRERRSSRRPRLRQAWRERPGRSSREIAAHERRPRAAFHPRSSTPSCSGVRIAQAARFAPASVVIATLLAYADLQGERTFARAGAPRLPNRDDAAGGPRAARARGEEDARRSAASSSPWRTTWNVDRWNNYGERPRDPVEPPGFVDEDPRIRGARAFLRPATCHAPGYARGATSRARRSCTSARGRGAMGARPRPARA